MIKLGSGYRFATRPCTGCPAQDGIPTVIMWICGICDLFNSASSGSCWIRHTDAQNHFLKADSFDDAVIYADYIWCYPGEPVYLDGFYWGSYNGWSELLILDPLWDVVAQADVEVVDDFFDAYINAYHTPGRYLVLLYDDFGGLAASTAFHVLPDA